MKKLLPLLLLGFHAQLQAGPDCGSPPCSVKPDTHFSAKVIAVIDGDTLLILHHGQPRKVRLADIDAPEKGQDFGRAAGRSLADMVSGKQVEITSRATDQYGRLVAAITVDGLDVNAEQVRRGMAWQYAWHTRNPPYQALEEAARKAHRGLWAQPHPLQPSLWRKAHPLQPAGQ